MFRTAHPTTRSLIAPVVLLALAFAACGDDASNGVAPPAGDPLIDTWVSTSLIANGIDLSLGGLALTITFNADGTYDTSVTGDNAGVFCDTGTSCTDGGTYSVTATQMTLDAGSQDEAVLNYAIAGDTLTATGNLDGVAATLIFMRQ